MPMLDGLMSSVVHAYSTSLGNRFGYHAMKNGLVVAASTNGSNSPRYQSGSRCFHAYDVVRPCLTIDRPKNWPVTDLCGSISVLRDSVPGVCPPYMHDGTYNARSI